MDSVRKDKQPSETNSGILYLHDVVYMLAAMLVVLTLFFRVIVVNGPSMKNTLLDGDYMLLVSNLFYRQPKAGDVVVICKKAYDDGKPLVKRVIATEGQIVDVDFEQGIVYVDGLPLDEPYISTPTTVEEGMAFPQIIEKGCVFVMGDNRQNSRDSRFPRIGQVDTREVLGKVAWMIFPGTDYGSSPRDFSRIGAIK